MSMRVANPTINPTGLNANQMLQFGLAQSAVKLVESGKLSEANQLLKLAVDPNEISNKTSEIEELLSIGGEDARIKFRELTKLSEEPAGVQKFKDTEKVMARAKAVMGPSKEKQKDDLMEMNLGIDWVYYSEKKWNGLSFKEDRKKDILSLIRIIVMSIVNSDKELFNSDGSNLSSYLQRFNKPHLINGERISLRRLCQWESRVRGKKEDGSEYSVKEIIDGWRKTVFGLDVKDPNEGIEVLVVDMEIMELKEMSLLHIHSLVWSITMYSEDYNGDPSKLVTTIEKFNKPYLINGERISLLRLYQWESSVRGKKEDGSDYSMKEIINGWKQTIFGIDPNEGIEVLPVDIEIPKLKEMSLLHIHSLVWSIVMHGKDYNGDPFKLITSPEKFNKPHLINGERISLKRLYYWEKRVRGKKEDGSDYSMKEIINIWQNEIDWRHGFLQKKNGKGVVVLVNKRKSDDPTLTPILNSSRLLSRLITNQDYRLKIKGELLKRWIRPYEHNVGKTIFLINKFRDEIENEDVKALIEEVVNEIEKYSEMKARGR